MDNKDFDILEYWVCATNKYSNFTYGKTYKARILHKIFNGERSITRVNGNPCARIVDNREFSKFIIRDEMEFITLNEWRNRKLEQIGI